MPLDGGEAAKRTSAKSSMQTFRWAPDSKHIAYLTTDPKTDSDEKKAKEFDDAKIIDRDNKPARLWTIDIAEKTVHQETKDAWAVRELDWMPDGNRLLIVATDRPTEERHTNRIFLLARNGGAMEQVLAPRGPFHNVKVAPGGASFAFVGARIDGPGAHDLFVCPLDSRSPRNITADTVDRPVINYEWMNESDLAVLFTNGFHTELNLIGNRPRKLIQDDSVDPAGFALNAQ